MRLLPAFIDGTSPLVRLHGGTRTDVLKKARVRSLTGPRNIWGLPIRVLSYYEIYTRKLLRLYRKVSIRWALPETRRRMTCLKLNPGSTYRINYVLSNLAFWEILVAYVRYSRLPKLPSEQKHFSFTVTSSQRRGSRRPCAHAWICLPGSDSPLSGLPRVAVRCCPGSGSGQQSAVSRRPRKSCALR